MANDNLTSSNGPTGRLGDPNLDVDAQVSAASSTSISTLSHLNCELSIAGDTLAGGEVLLTEIREMLDGTGLDRAQSLLTLLRAALKQAGDVVRSASDDLDRLDVGLLAVTIRNSEVQA